MPESKKLSELIEELIYFSNIFEDERKKEDGDGRKMRNANITINKIKNQIDQKFEELRCECKKEKESNENDNEKYLNIKVNQARNIIEGNGFEIRGDEKIFREFVKGFLYEKDTTENP